MVHPPVGVGAALRQLVLPQFRGGVAGLNVINEAAAPALARAVQEMQSKRREKRAR